MRRAIVVTSIFIGYGFIVACSDRAIDAPSEAPIVSAQPLTSDLPIEFFCADTPPPPPVPTPVVAPPPRVVGPADAATVIDILTQCADSGPYNPFNICTTSCNRVQSRCKAEGIGCRTATLKCGDDPAAAGHAINIVQIPGKGWCAVDTTASPEPPFNSEPRIYEPCYDDPRKVVLDQTLACRVMGVDTDGGPCPCAFTGVVDQPQPINYDPKACRADNPTDTDKCRECCTTDGVLQYCRAEGIECKDYLKQCLAACAAPAPEAGTPEAGADATAPIDAAKPVAKAAVIR